MYLQACHSTLLTKFDMACGAIHSNKINSRKRGRSAAAGLEDSDGDERGNSSNSQLVSKQAKLVLGQPVTQRMLDDWVTDYLVDCVLPLHHIDTTGFHLFVKRLTHERLLPRCRQTLTKQLEEHFTLRILELKQKLATVETIHIIADCWTRRRHSFIGITVHWLDTGTMERKGCCLAVRKITGSHKYDRLAKELKAVNRECGITDKICFTVTDSRANFLKAFSHFSKEETEAVVSAADSVNDDEADEEEEDIEYFKIDDMLNASADDDEQILNRLPPHLANALVICSILWHRRMLTNWMA